MNRNRYIVLILGLSAMLIANTTLIINDCNYSVIFRDIVIGILTSIAIFKITK